MVLCSRRAPHPRDGPWAWLVCFVSTTIFGLMFGYLLSFGVLLPVLSDHFVASRGKTAWIGSLGIGFAFLCGPLASFVITRFGERNIAVCGGLSAAALLIISSYMQNMLVLFVSHGILLGVSGSFILNALLLIVRKYFKKKLALAVGITTSGSGFGVLTIGPALQALIDFLGWRGALRVQSGAMFMISLLSIFYDPNIERDEQDNEVTSFETPQRKSCWQLIDCSMWKSPKYTIGTMSIFLTFFGLFVPMIHLVRFSKEYNISGSKSSFLFFYIGVFSTVVRLVIGKVLDKKWLTPLQGVQLSSFIVGTSMISLTQVKTYTHFILFSVFFGLGNGAFVATQALFYLTCFTDVKKTSASVGTGLMVSSFALFAGSPVAGFIADVFDSYIPAFFIFGGLVVLAGTLPFCLLLCKRETLESENRVETRLTLVGSRLANVDSFIDIDNDL